MSIKNVKAVVTKIREIIKGNKQTTSGELIKMEVKSDTILPKVNDEAQGFAVSRREKKKLIKEYS